MRSLAFIIALLGTAALQAQQLDTIFLKHPVYAYMVWTEAVKESGDGLVSYYDSTDVLRATTQWRHHKPDGDFTYFENGHARAVVPYRKGKMEGVIRTFHNNGKLEWTKPYRRGKLFGERMLLDSTGAPVNGGNVDELLWGQGQVFTHCVNGRPEGKVVVKVNGRISYIGNFTTGMPDGDYIYYNAAGTPVRKDLYKDGRFVRSEELNQ